MVIPLYRQPPPCLMIMVCGDPASGTDHSLKEVSAYIIWYRVHTWGLQGKCHRLFSVLFCIYLQIYNYVSVKNSSVCTYNVRVYIIV